MVKKNAHAIALKRIEESERTCESRLDLSDLGLGALPPEIGKLKNLSILYLQFNQLTSLPPEIGNLTTLTHLSLRRNQLSSLPPEIGQLTSLSTLHLNDNQLSSLPPEIGKLSNLTELDLDNNQISSLPRILGELAKLTRLDIDDNGLLSIPPQIGNLVELAFLYARRNRLSSLPADIGNLTNLTLLDLGANQLSSLPQELGNIKNLITLDLDENQLLSLPPEIGKLTNLETLHLRDNQLSELPPELGELQNLTTLNLANNRLSDAIMAAKERGTRELLAYLRSLKEGEALYESKLVLVGEGEVGKTSLVEAMKGKAFVKGRTTTHGIEISQLDLPHPQLDKTITLNAWDFGGQPVYRVTHQFFFSRRSLYLLLWSPRMGVEQCDVEGWIKRIKLRVGDEARIIIVATHCKTGGRIARIDEEQLIRDYGDMIVGFHEVDSGVNVDPTDSSDTAEKVGVEDLKRKIAKAAAGLPQMGEMFSRKWKAARDEVLALGRPPEARPRVAYSTFADTCSKHGLDGVDTDTLAGLMHDLGHVVYYSDDEGLKDEMVLQPEWMTKAIGFVLEDKETNDKSGELEHARLRGIWYDHEMEDRERYDPEFHSFFLRLMEKHDVSYRLDGGQASLVTQLVPNVRPDNLPWDIGEPSPGRVGQVSLVCQMDAEPPGLVPWMIVRTHHFATYPRRHWQKGMFLKYDGHGEALLEVRKGGREFIATVRAAWPNYFMSIIQYTLDRLITDRWPGLEKIYSVPCPERSNGDSCDGRFELDSLRQFLVEGDKTIRCQRCRKIQNIPKMLVGFEELTERESLMRRLDEATTDRDQYARAATEERNRLASYAARMFSAVLRAIGSENRECPRIFTLLPEKLSGFNPANIGKTGHRLTLWCEYAGEQHPTCTIGSGKKDAKQGERGEYIFKGTKEWLVNVAPYAKLVAGLLKAVVPIAGAATKMLVDKTLLDDVGPKLDLMEKITASLLQGEFDTRRAPKEPSKLVTQAEGDGVRALHNLLLKLDPDRTWGGLRRALTPTGEYLWLCPTHYRKYEPDWPKL